jgi:predicted DNA repair protein MutK
VIARIARGSLINKIVIILPAALLLSYFVPWVITPILMLGGSYLCFEGAEKVLEAVRPHKETLAEQALELVSADHEKMMVKGAVRTDFILSTEIMVIALKEVSELSIAMQAAALFAVAVVITLLVYGVVGLIVKMDDVGLHLAKRPTALLQNAGKMLVLGMPKLLAALSIIGIAAMLWVGGQIVLHGANIHPAEWLGLHGGAAAWIIDAVLSGLFGLVLGSVIALVLHRFASHH